MSEQLLTVEDIQVRVLRKRMKNLRLVVSGPDGQVRVSAPKRVSDREVRDLVVSKLGWIRKHQAKFLAQPRRAALQFRSGEEHKVFGKTYSLEIIENSGRQRVELLNERLCLFVKPGATPAQREQLLDNWYRQQLKERVPELIAKWQPIIGKQVADWGIRKMKTRWGSCNITRARISLSLELAKKPPECLEYILVHEMVHLHERYHNARFYGLMDQFLPQWKALDELLKQA